MLGLMIACFSLPVSAQESSGPASVCATDGGFTLTNGAVELRLDEGGVLRWLSRTDTDNLLANGGQGYWNAHCDSAKQTRGFVAPKGPGKIVRRTPDLVEVAFRHEPYGRWPFEAFPFDAHHTMCCVAATAASTCS